MKLFGSYSKSKRVEKRVEQRVEKRGKPGRTAPRAAGPRGFWRAMPAWSKVVVCCIGVMALTISVLALALRTYVRLPPEDKNVSPPPDDEVLTSPDPFETPSGQPDTSPGPDDSPPPEKVMTVREGVYSFVMAGQNEGLTDTLMVALLDLKAMTLNVISIPRDTIVDAKFSIPKINSAYGAGGGGKKGMDRLRLELCDIVGFVPANYALVSMRGFEVLVDTLEGVNFDVPCDMYVEYENIDLKAGYQPLNGEKALMLMRYRGYASSDYGRMQTQQKFLTALGKKILSWKNIPKIGDLASIFVKYLTSNLDAGQMAGVGEQLLKLKSEDIHFYTLPSTAIHYKGGGIPSEWYVTINSEEALELINSTINPYTEDITPDMVKHIQLSNP